MVSFYTFTCVFLHSKDGKAIRHGGGKSLMVFELPPLPFSRGRRVQSRRELQGLFIFYVKAFAFLSS